MELVKLAQDPEIDIDNVVKVIGIDPALTAKIMRRANSPLYANQTKVKSLQKAVMLIGLNGILSLALSFSIVRALRRESDLGLDHNAYWRRSLISGSAALALGQACKRQDLEEIFVAAFLQDIGMLVLDKVDPSLYAHPHLRQSIHAEVIQHEQEQFGATHVVVGAWLLSEWNFPKELVTAIMASDDPRLIPEEEENRVFVQCVALGGTMADLCMTQATDEALLEFSEHLQHELQLGPLAFIEIFKNLNSLLIESEPLFEIQSVEGEDPDALLDRAQQLLELRTAKLDLQINKLAAQI